MSAPLFFSFVIAIGLLFLIATRQAGKIEHLENRLDALERRK